MMPVGYAKLTPISPGKARTRAPVAEPVHHALAATSPPPTKRRALPMDSTRIAGTDDLFEKEAAN
jgi:hypothetical protein